MYGGEQVCFHMWLAKKKKRTIMGSRVDSYLRVPPIRDICPVDRSDFPQLYQTWTPVKRCVEKKRRIHEFVRIRPFLMIHDQAIIEKFLKLICFIITNI